MKYDVLYEVEFGTLNWTIILIPLCLILIGLYAIKMIKKYGYEQPMQMYGVLSGTNYVWVAKFFSFTLTLFGFISLIGTLVMIPSKIIERKNIERIIHTQSFNMVEGYVENFLPSDSLKRNDESFEINGVRFRYSETDDFYGYSKIASNGGIINSNGEYYKLSYYIKRDNNIIIRIEGLRNH